jgi:membrane-associated phospholipid phosphatase
MRRTLVAGCAFVGLAVAAPAHANDDFWHAFADVGAIGIPVAAGIITLHERDKNGLYQLTETGFVALVSTQVLKYSVDSTRPNGGDQSFPSGHTAMAFAGAGYLHARYGWKTSLPFEILAAGVGFARVQTKDHYWYDVVAGAVIGEGAAFLFTRRLHENVRISAGGDTTGGMFSVAAKF